MKIELHCAVCASNEDDAWYNAAAEMPFNNEGVYRFTCPKGHANAVILRHLRFEVLAEVALQAIVDGYHREAVTSFNASLERFYQFYIEAIVYDSTAPGEFNKTWSLVSKSSERQFGMFCGLYWQENKALPPVLPQQDNASAGSVSFRNKVVHEGLIPTEKQAVEFGQAVVGLVRPILLSLYESHATAITGLHRRDRYKAETFIDQTDILSTMAMPMVYPLFMQGGVLKSASLEKLIATRRRNREAWGKRPN